MTVPHHQVCTPESDGVPGAQTAVQAETAGLQPIPTAQGRMLEQQLEEAEAEVLRLRQQLRDVQMRQHWRVGELVRRHERERLALTTDLVSARQATRHSLRVQQQILDAFAGSTSWRITRPLRVANRLVRGQGLHAPAPHLPPQPTLPPVELSETRPPGDQASAKTAMRDLLRIRLDAFLASSTTLRLPRAEAPSVSILLVLFNQAELTLACLSAIVETLDRPDAPSIEVVIVDNASSDATPDLLDRVEGATIIRNPTNLHFLHGVNAGAQSVRGSSILLLNNDALLLPGSLASALRTLGSAPDIGAVGGRIVLPDARLQEAGSIIWHSGACLGYGRGEDPNDPAFAFQRDVDFCSGAFLLVPTRLWKLLGGFDVRFAPAYYEEVDFCVRLWRSGFRVVFDPDATIIHFEFGSSAASQDALALQAANHAVFTETHRDWLASRQADQPSNRFAASDVGRGWRLLLVLRPGEAVPRLVPGAVDAGVRVTVLLVGDRGGTGLDRRVETAFAQGPDDVLRFLQERAGHYRLILGTALPDAVSARVGGDGGTVLDLHDIEGLAVALAGPVCTTNPPAELPTSRPADQDVAVAVPFRFPPLPRDGSSGTELRVGVFCHLFYPEMARVLLPYLENIGGPKDLHISTDTAEKAEWIKTAFEGWNGDPPDIQVFPNRGRDVAAKLVGFARAQSRYDVVLHLHGKRSDHSSFLAPWGGFLLENLLGSPSVVSSVLDAFRRTPDLGMVASQHFEAVRRWIGWHGNLPTALTLAERMGVSLRASQALDFPSGSMFWARPAALAPLLDLKLTWEDFPAEEGQQDHTLAHAIERLFFYSCERSGLSWLKVGDPSLFHNPGPMVDMVTPQALMDFMAADTVRLSGEEPVAVRPDPAPMMTQMSPGLARRLAARAS